MPLRPKIALVLAVAAAVVGADLVTKAVSERAFSDQPTLHLLGDTVRVGFVLNTGVFLSLGSALAPTTRFWLFVVGVGGVLAMLLGLPLRDARFRRPEVVAVAAIVGGDREPRRPRPARCGPRLPERRDRPAAHRHLQRR
jgi:signal peptidase II